MIYHTHARRNPGHPHPQAQAGGGDYFVTLGNEGYNVSVTT